MNQEYGSDVELPQLKFVSLKYHWEREGIMKMEVVRVDGTVQRFQTEVESEKELLVKLAKEIELQIDRWNQERKS